MRTILALLPDFLAQRQREIQESREAHIRVKSVGTVQETLNRRVTVLEALQREASAQQTASEAALATLGRRQNAIESDHSAIEAALSEVRRDVFEMRSVRESATQTERELTQLAAEVRSVRSGSEAVLEGLSRRADAAEELLSREAVEVTALGAVAESAQKDSALALERLSRGEADVALLAAEREAVGQLLADVTSLKNWTGWLDSRIVTEFPPLFEEFRTKRFNLLWRGSRDGFTAQKSHLRCDGCANTLTLISDTKGNVFGGFTPVKWEFLNGQLKGDDSLRSFLFTLRNPRSIPPRKFALKEEMKQNAIRCYSAFCAAFGNCDLHVSDNCNANRYSHTRIGTNWSDRTYANDTTFKDFFTGAESLTVKEIEVFEIAD
jgi:hypothetical protein